MDTILVVDDNKAVCSALTLMLELHGYRALSCDNAATALEWVAAQDIDLVIQDMNFTRDTTSGEDGKILFYGLREIQPDIPIILMTAWTQLETAVELVKAGAADYMGKPWDDSKLLTSINNLVALHKLSRANRKLARADTERMQAIAGADLCGLVFGSGAMQRCVDLAVQLAGSDVSVLITGPNGAGKEKIADILHANSSLKDQPFIKVNVGALPMELMEAELFGAEAGAFTGATKARIGRFEAADGGTLFLDEIGNLPLSGQVKLLRVLQTGEFERLGNHKTRKVKVRVLSATNANLTDAIARGSFREDLYYRLNVVELTLPPLARRPDDILPLVAHFIGSAWVVAKAAQRALLNHPWPGNVRELENACKRAVLLAKSSELSVEDFGLVAPERSVYDTEAKDVSRIETPASLAGVVDTQPITAFKHQEGPELGHSKDVQITKPELEAALEECGGVIARVAKVFGVSRQSLYRRMDKLGIDRH